MSVQQGRGRVALSSYRRLKEIGRFLAAGSEDQDRPHASDSRPPRRDRPSCRWATTCTASAVTRQFVRKYGKPGRYFLHAAELKFTHPRNGRERFNAVPSLRLLLERSGTGQRFVGKRDLSDREYLLTVRSPQYPVSFAGRRVIALGFGPKRKVRAPQGSVPRNSWARKGRKVQQKTYRRWTARSQVRVKRCGKSAPAVR